MNRAEAAVGLSVELEGRDALFQSIGEIQDRLANMLSSAQGSGYNPLATPPAAGGAPAPLAPPGYPSLPTFATWNQATGHSIPLAFDPGQGSFFNPNTGTEYKGASWPGGGGAVSIQSVTTITIATVTNLVIQNVSGGVPGGTPGGTGGGGGGGAEPGWQEQRYGGFAQGLAPGLQYWGRRSMPFIAGATALAAGDVLWTGLYPQISGKDLSAEAMGLRGLDAISSLPLVGQMLSPFLKPARWDLERDVAMKNAAARAAMAGGGPAGGATKEWLRYFSTDDASAGGVSRAEYLEGLGADVPGFYEGGALPRWALGLLEWKFPRPEDRAQAVPMFNALLRQAWGHPDIAKDLAGGRGALTEQDLRRLTSLAVIGGDLQALTGLEASAGAVGFDEEDWAGMRGRAVGFRRLELRGRSAGIESQRAEVSLQRAQATFRGYGTVTRRIGELGDPLRERIGVLDERISRARAEIVPGDIQGELLIDQMEAERDSLGAQVAALPFRQIETRYSGQMAMAGAQLSQGQTELSLVRAFGIMPGERSREAFEGIRGGMTRQIRTARRKYQALRDAGVTAPDELEPLAAEIAEMEAGLERLPLQEIDFEFGTRGRVLGAQRGIAETRLARRQPYEFYGPEQETDYRAIQRVIERQIAAVAERLRRTTEAGGGLAETEPIRQEMESLRTQLRQSLFGQARQAFQDVQAQAVAPGAIAGFRLGAMATMGRLWGPEMEEEQGARRRSLQQQSNNALQRHLQATAQGDQRAALDALVEHNRLQAQIESLPAREIAERYDPAATYRQAGMAVYGAGATEALARGAGTVATLPLLSSRMTEQGALLASERARLEAMRSGGLGEAAIRQQEARVAELQAGAEQLRGSLGQYQSPVGMREDLAQLQYQVSVLSSVPGSYGNLRGALRGLMGGLGEQAGDVAAQLREAERSGNPEAVHALRSQLRQIGMQQLGAFNQLSFGWESRLVGQMLNAPGDMNLEARGFAWRDAVLGGAWNPHFGATEEQLPFFMKYASNVPFPVVPGYRGFPTKGPAGTFFDSVAGDLLAGAASEGRQPIQIVINMIPSGEVLSTSTNVSAEDLDVRYNAGGGGGRQ